MLVSHILFRLPTKKSSKLREEGAGPFICDYRIAEERGFIQEEMRRKHAEDLKEEEKQGPKTMFILIPS